MENSERLNWWIRKRFAVRLLAERLLSLGEPPALLEDSFAQHCCPLARARLGTPVPVTAASPLSGKVPGNFVLWGLILCQRALLSPFHQAKLY